jgi:two-component system, NarL family, sensor kinase
MQTNKYDIVIFLIVTTAIILLLAAFIITLIYLYQKKQITYQQKMDTLKLDHEKNLMSTQLEIQENTFQHISREIHDNISLSLTLAKLNLNTFDWKDTDKACRQLKSSVEMLSRAITDLSDISKSLNSEIISSQGLIKALENEIGRIQQTVPFTIHFNITGEPVYLDTQKELIVFRMIQEAFNNIIKHAKASYTSLTLHYTSTQLHVTISDNGKGFKQLNDHITMGKTAAGIKNMEARAKMIGGTIQIKSTVGTGTFLNFNIPI